MVKNEVKVNVLNQPYGGFPWIDLPMAANTNWYNAHNFYGDLAHLDAATLDDVKAFFKTFYAPNNAVLVVSGDFDAGRAKSWIEKYFATIPSAKLPPPPDLAEPRQETERKARAPIRSRPGRPSASPTTCPSACTPEWYAFGLIDQVLGQGADSLALRRAGAEARRSPAASTPASTGGSATCSTTAARCCGSRRCSTTPTTASDACCRRSTRSSAGSSSRRWIRRRSTARA